MGRQCEQKTPSFPFLDLPCELQYAIFREIPDLWTVVSLRQTSRKVNGIYLSDEPEILRAQRDRIVRPFYDYYQFHALLHITGLAVTRPPPEGWSEITPKKSAHLEKSDFAVDVLRHLPYLSQISTKPDRHSIANRCVVVNYTRDTKTAKRRRDLSQHLNHAGRVPFPGATQRHVLQLARGLEPGSTSLYLNVMRGTIHEIAGEESPDRTIKDITQFIADETQRFRTLEEVFCPGQGTIRRGKYFLREHIDAYKQVLQRPPARNSSEPFGTDEDYFRVRHLYLKFGWPDNGWRKDECMHALERYSKWRKGLIPQP